MNEETVQTLGTREYLLRTYEDQTVPEGTPGRLINLNVNYYASGDSTLHVLETRWTGQRPRARRAPRYSTCPMCRAMMAASRRLRVDAGELQTHSRWMSTLHGDYFQPPASP